MCADLPPNAAARFFIATSRSDGTITRTGLAVDNAVKVFGTHGGTSCHALAG